MHYAVSCPRFSKTSLPNLPVPLSNLTPKIAISKFQRFQFQWSSGEYGLQAADLFCHLTYNAVRHGMGIVNDITTLKTELPKKIVTSFALRDDVKAELAVGQNTEGKDDNRCANPKITILDAIPACLIIPVIFSRN